MGEGPRTNTVYTTTVTETKTGSYPKTFKLFDDQKLRKNNSSILGFSCSIHDTDVIKSKTYKR